MDQKKIQVFLSYKHHDKDGNVLNDYYMAEELYRKLIDMGISTFFSDFAIASLGQSDYKKLIDDRLDETKLLVVVSTSPEHCNSNWVRYEWDSFYNDILSERKNGELISYLDTNDIGAFPRTIRNLQVFEKKENGLNEILKFVRHYFNLGTDNCEKRTFKGSSYNYNSSYELGDERKRLAIQAKVESSMDPVYLSELLTKKDITYNILDVGCSMGAVTFDVFSKTGVDCNVLGVDKYKECVDGFNNDAPSENFHAECMDFEEDNWTRSLEYFMNKYDISKFDLVYCSLSLHHMSDSGSVIKKLWKYIKNEGYIYIRTCDDALKIAYPNESIMHDIMRKTASVPNVSDRFHGRKIYSMLYTAKYKNIKIKTFLIDTGNKDIEERYALFYSAFVWRKNYFKNQLEKASSQEEIEKAMEEYNDINNLLDKIENLFTDQSFYFGYYVTIAIGQKKDFGLFD